MDTHNETPKDLTSSHDDRPVPCPQGGPLGPPVKDWVFDAEIEAIKARIGVPTEVLQVETGDLYCICRGIDDGSEMIYCSNGEKCLYGWFHTACIGMRQLPDEEGICITYRYGDRADLCIADEWYCERCQARLDMSAQQNQEISGSGPSLPDDDAPSSSPVSSNTVSTRRSRRPTKPSASLLLSSQTSSSPVSALGKRVRISAESPRPRKKRDIKPALAEVPNEGGAESDPIPTESPPSYKPPWEDHEIQAMISSMGELVNKGNHKDCDFRWKYISESMAKQGMTRSWSSVRMAWMRFGREMSGIDERETNRGGRMSVGRRKSK